MSWTFLRRTKEILQLYRIVIWVHIHFFSIFQKVANCTLREKLLFMRWRWLKSPNAWLMKIEETSYYQLFETSNKEMKNPFEAKKKGDVNGYLRLKSEELDIIWDKVADNAQRIIWRVKMNQYRLKFHWIRIWRIQAQSHWFRIHSSRKSAILLIEKDWYWPLFQWSENFHCRW